MAEGSRPGGLTALAVLNFIGSGFTTLFTLALVALIAMFGLISDAAANDANVDEQSRAAIEAWQESGIGFFYLHLLLYLAITVLLIASGVGYLKQKRFLGRKLGNAYAITSLVNVALSTAAVPAEAGGGFSLGTLVSVTYPVLTLIFLNTTFKEDFVN